jgi:hypothetical protein
MTGEELVKSLLDRISLRRAYAKGEVTLTLSGLEQLLRSSLVPMPEQPEPGFPKWMVRTRLNATPWVPKGPEPPEHRQVRNKIEAQEAVAEGFREDVL